MKLNDLAKRWAGRLTAYLAEKGLARDHLLASDFGTHLCLRLEDNSSAFFKHAFCLKDNERNEIAVFTEHCGYHIFPLIGTEIEIVEAGDVSNNAEWLEEFFQSADQAGAFSDGERWTRNDLYRYWICVRSSKRSYLY